MRRIGDVLRRVRDELAGLPGATRAAFLAATSLLAVALAVVAVGGYALTSWRSYATAWTDYAHAVADERDATEIEAAELTLSLSEAEKELERLATELREALDGFNASEARIADLEDQLRSQKELADDLRAEITQEIEDELEPRLQELEDRERSLEDADEALREREQAVAERETAVESAPARGSADGSPDPAPAARPSDQGTVHPGAFCSPIGATGVTVAGTPMECKTTATDSRARWRQR